MKRRPIRKFPDEWFSTEVVVPTGGSEPREVGFSRSAHGQGLLAGIRQAYLSKPKNPIVADQHVYFAARTWKDRPSLRRNIENVNARIHRVLPDGSIIGSWASKSDYDESKAYVAEYQRKQNKAADLDFIESIKGLDHKDKLGRSLLEVLEEEDVHREGQLSVVFYPDYTEKALRHIVEAIEAEFAPRGLTLDRVIAGIGRVTAVFRGPLHLSDEIADRVEAIAVVEQVGELRPAGPVASGSGAAGQLQVAIRPQLPEVAVLDTGVSGKHPMLQGVLLSGDPAVDHVDAEPDGGHGTFVAGVVAYGEDPEAQISEKSVRPRALIHSRRVALSNVQGGMNLDNYEEFAKTVEALRKHTKVFTASLSERIPIDSDNISSVALNIDLISERYGVLFVLPMGNLPNVIDGQVSPSQPNYADIPSWCTDPNAPCDPEIMGADDIFGRPWLERPRLI